MPSPECGLARLCGRTICAGVGARPDTERTPVTQRQGWWVAGSDISRGQSPRGGRLQQPGTRRQRRRRLRRRRPLLRQ